MNNQIEIPRAFSPQDAIDKGLAIKTEDAVGDFWTKASHKFVLAKQSVDYIFERGDIVDFQMRAK